MEVQVPEQSSNDRLNNMVAISVAVLSGFMAVTKVKDDNVVQAMLQAKNDAMDTWNEYQSKKIKHHLDDLGIIQLQALKMSGANAEQLNAKVAQLQADVERYKGEEKSLLEKAKTMEAQYDALNVHDDQFDMSDATLSLSLTILAAVALTRKRVLLYLAWTFGIFGIITGLAGLLGWGFHPDWLAKLLT